MLSENDRIGWSFPGDMGIISFDYLYGQHVKFFHIADIGDIVVEETYEFAGFVMPAKFSVAVQVDTSKLH